MQSLGSKELLERASLIDRNVSYAFVPSELVPDMLHASNATESGLSISYSSRLPEQSLTIGFLKALYRPMCLSPYDV
ncbi:hypothetical protein DL93DRAFT_2092385 [Clavulina sp. PMI_390]|nr:hypothetical protein DL93DRAFT_2092385 [Clavulina sp. PMI_390]